MKNDLVIVDFSQVMISNLMAQLGKHTNIKLEEEFLRNVILKSILKIRVNFPGELVIACDSRSYWRKEVFPYYKANRKKTREKSELDWTTIFKIFDVLKSELFENFTYPVIEIFNAEADDVIASLVFGNYGADKNIMILSGDKDFMQLQKYPNVRQYDFVQKRFISAADPTLYLKEHIIRGDIGDGIPNYLSPDNCLVVGERQKSIMAIRVKEWLELSPEEFCTADTFRNYKRNEQLIDLKNIPKDISLEIMKSYESQKDKPKNKMFGYFVKNNLRELLGSVHSF